MRSSSSSSTEGKSNEGGALSLPAGPLRWIGRMTNRNGRGRRGGYPKMIWPYDADPDELDDADYLIWKAHQNEWKITDGVEETDGARK